MRKYIRRGMGGRGREWRKVRNGSGNKMVVGEGSKEAERNQRVNNMERIKQKIRGR